MPNFDKTGPQGQGKMTGRSLGNCGQGKTRGLGRGLGFGGRCCNRSRGLSNFFGENATRTKEDQAENLKAYKQSLQEELKNVETALAAVQ